MHKDEQAKTYTAHLTALTVFRDSQGNITRRMSRDLPLQGSLDKLRSCSKATSSTPITLRFRPVAIRSKLLSTTVSPTRSARRRPAWLSLPPAAIGLSDIVFVRRVDKDKSAPGNPFRFSGGKVTPSLSTSVSAGKGAQLPLYFVVLRPHPFRRVRKS